MSFNLVDALLLLVVLLGAWAGWGRGFLFASLDLLTLATSLVAAFLAYRWPEAWLDRLVPQLGVWTAPISFVLVFVLVHLILASVAMRLARRVPGKVHTHAANRLLGLAPGTLNGLIHATVVAVVLLIAPLGSVSTWSRDSVLAQRLSAPAEWLEARLAPIFDPAIQRTLRVVTVPPQSRASVPLRTRVESAKPRPDLEARMLELVNAERAQAGLRPLRADPELVPVARAHSRDMFSRGYFSHYSPEGEDLAHRMREAGVRFLTAGENLALAPTLQGAHQGLMRSPGHRANILRPQFGRVGIGVLDGGVHGLMVTQNFRN